MKEEKEPEEYIPEETNAHLFVGIAIVVVISAIFYVLILVCK